MLNHALPIKLDKDNYMLWRTQMENVIYANDIEDHVEGLTVYPSKTISNGEINPEFILWIRFDRMILSWIYSSLTPEIMGQIIGYQTSHEAWFALEKIFSASFKAWVMQLRLEFQTTKKRSLSMMDYILKLKNLVDNLAAIGESVHNRDHILQLLGGLGVEYNSIVASLIVREDEVSLHTAHRILLTYEQRLNLQNSTKDNVISTNLTTTSSYHHKNRRNSNRNFLGNNSRIFNPGRNSHANRNSASQNHPQCQLCGKFGHVAAQCYHCFDINFQGVNNNSETKSHATNNNQDQAHAMIASPTNINSKEWFFDTSATHHLSQTTSLDNLQSYNGNDKVKIGNGMQLPILHTGTKFFSLLLKCFG